MAGKITGLAEHDKRAAAFTKQDLAMPIEHQLLMFCIRKKDLLVPPEVYMRELLLREGDVDRLDRL